MRFKSGLGILICVAAAALAAPAASAQPRPPRVFTSTTGQSSYLGIGVADITPERARALNLKEERGAEVTSVREDSPAAKAGLKEGDVVLEYNGQPIQGTEQLTRLVRETPVGRQAKILVSRAGSTQTLTATIAAQKGAVIFGHGDGPFVMPNITIPPMEPMDIPQFQMAWRSPSLGIIGEALREQDQLAEFFGAKQGVLVKSVTRNSAAEKAGIKAGDVIVKIDDTNITSTDGIRRALSSAGESKSTFTVVVIRDKKETPITVTIERAGGGRPIRAALEARYC